VTASFSGPVLLSYVLSGPEIAPSICIFSVRLVHRDTIEDLRELEHTSLAISDTESK
jgi:hypothetical protein